MSKSTHKTEYRILAGLLALLCLFSFVLGSVPRSYADPLPVNVSLFLRDGSGETAEEWGPDHVYEIAGETQNVFVRVNISFNGTYEEDKLRVEIPYNAFVDRDGKSYKMDDASRQSLISKLSEPTSQMKVIDNGYTSGTIVLHNKTATALQLNLYLTYNVEAYSVEDGAKQDFTVTVTDNDTGDSASAELHPSFVTHVDSVNLSKVVHDHAAPNGCYPQWDSTLETWFKLSDLGIGEDEFNELCKDNYFVCYRLEGRASAENVNQKCHVYIDDKPVGGEVVMVSRLNGTYASPGEPLKKVTEGEFAGQWVFENAPKTSRVPNPLQFYVLAKYPKSGTYESETDKDGNVSAPILHNQAEMTLVGVDNGGAKRASNTADRKSVWMEAAAGSPGDIWGVSKKEYTDPAGALNVLRNGGDVSFSYDISGVGLTYKYIADRNYEKANANDYSDFGGPYRLDLIDDALYVNGLGENGTDVERLKPEDFYFKTFTMRLEHNVVDSVNLKGEIRDKHAMPMTDREQIKVWVMTEGSEEWKLDQTLENNALVNSSGNPSDHTYADGDNNEVFAFKNDKVYRVKFVYDGANGEVKMYSTLTGILRSEGSTVQAVLANLEENNIGNFQLFNWDAEMGFNAKGNWEDPDSSGSIYSDSEKMKKDLLELDAKLYDGHTTDRISHRQVGKNNLAEVDFYSGAGKTGRIGENGIMPEEGKIKAQYMIAAVMGGGAVSEENLKEMIEMGMLEDCREMVFYELLPVGMKIKNVEAYEEKNASNWAGFNSGEFTWKSSSRTSYLKPISGTVPTVSYTVESENYKGTHRQLVKINVKYDVTPVIAIDLDHDQFALGEVLIIDAEAEYADLRSQTLDNHIVAQFVKDGKPLELDGTAVYPDDGTIFEDVTDKDGNKVFDDIDGDGDHDSKTIVGSSLSGTWQNTVASTQLMKKIKEDELDEEFSDFTQTYAGHNYTYKLQFLLGEGTVRNLVIFDSIEEAVRNEDNESYFGKPDWKGTLYGVDIKEAQDMGFNDITVYVNTEKYYKNTEFATDYEGEYAGLTPADLTAANGWSVIDPNTYKDWDKVKTIAFGFGKDTQFSMDNDDPRGVTVYLKMKAPDTIHKDQTKTSQILAYNQPAYYSEKKGLGEVWDHDTTVANVVTIGMKSATVDMPAVAKTYTGELYEGFEEICVFDIKPIDGSSAPRAYKDGVWGDEIDSVSITLNDKKSTDIASEYGSLLFTEPGEYEYEISEKADSKPGVTYSGAKYKVVFNVTDEREPGGKVPQYAADTELAVEMKIYRTHDEDGKALEEPIEVESIEFKNDYAPAPVEMTIEVEKKIEGPAPEEAETYEFELTAKDGAPVPEITKAAVTGEGKTAFGVWEYTEPGVYEYEVVEVKGGSEDCEYDDTVYTVTDTVTDNKGELNVSRVIKADDSEADSVVFVNTYEEEEDSSSEDESKPTNESDTDSRKGTTGDEDSTGSSSGDSSSQSEDSSSKSESSSSRAESSSSRSESSSSRSESSSSESESSSSTDESSSSDIDSSSSTDSSSSSDGSSDSSGGDSSTGTSSSGSGSDNPNTGSHISLGFTAALLGAAVCAKKKHRDDE